MYFAVYKILWKIVLDLVDVLLFILGKVDDVNVQDYR